MEPIVLKAITGLFASCVVGGGYVAYKNKNNVLSYLGESKDEKSNSPLSLENKQIDYSTGQQNGNYLYNNPVGHSEVANVQDDYAYAVVKPSNTSVNRVEKTNLFNNGEKNFQCHANNLIDRRCEIQSIDLSKNHYTFNERGFVANNNITQDEIDNNENLFLLRVHKSLITEIEKSDAYSETIDIFPTIPNTDTTEGKGDIGKMFTQFSIVVAKHKNKKYGKPSYLLAKIGSSLSSKLDGTNPANMACKFTDQEFVDCFIGKFSDTASDNYKNKIFSGMQTEVSITKGNYYLISFVPNTGQIQWTSEYLNKENLKIVGKQTKENIVTDIPIEKFYFAIYEQNKNLVVIE